MVRVLKGMKVHTFTTKLIQLNNSLPYFPPDPVGQMITVLSDDEVKKILFHAMNNTWRKKITKEWYNYLYRSIQEIPGFFERRVKNLETPAPLSRKKKKRNSVKRKAGLNMNFYVYRLTSHSKKK